MAECSTRKAGLCPVMPPGCTSDAGRLRGESQPTLVVRTELLIIRAPSPFVLVSQGWPSALTTACSLGLHVRAAYFRPSFHRFFKPDKVNLPCWLRLNEFQVSAVGNAVLVLSGEVEFVQDILRKVISSDLSQEDAGRVIVHVFAQRSKVSRRVFFSELARAERALEAFGFRHARWQDWLIGGPTNGLYVFGFWPTLSHHDLLEPVPGL